MLASALTKPTDVSPFLHSSDAYGVLACVRLFGGLAISIMLAGFVGSNFGAWAILLTPMIGIGVYKVTFLMHDCVHGTLFTSRRANRFVAYLSASVAALDFDAYASLHRLHHQSVGEPDDPQGHDYCNLDRGGLRLLVHLLRPLTGYNLFRLHQLRKERGNSRQIKSASRSFGLRLLCLVIAQASIAAVMSWGGQNPWMVLLFPASAASFGLFLSQLRGFCEHVAMPGELSEGCVRSHASSRLERLFLFDLNFNFHAEHHSYPAVPSCRLAALHRHLMQSGGGATLSPSYLLTLGRRFAAE